MVAPKYDELMKPLLTAVKKVVAENPEKIDSKYLEKFSSFAEFNYVTEPMNNGNIYRQFRSLQT